MYISHIPFLLIPFFSHILVIHQSCITSVMNRVSISWSTGNSNWFKSPLGIPYHTTYVELNLAYINLATRSSRTKPSPRHVRAQHASNPATFKPWGYMLLLPSHHSQCVGIRLSIGLAEVGLPEYVTSTTKCLIQKIHNEWPLSDIVDNITQLSR